MSEKLPGLSDAHHFAIANVASRTAQLDYHIEKTVAVALGKHPKTAEFLLKNLDMNRVLGILKALLLDLMPEEKQAISNLISEITDLRSDRNNTLHWAWHGTGDMNQSEAIATSLRPFRDFQYALKTAAEIQEIADSVLNASHALMEWQQELHKRVHGP